MSPQTDNRFGSVLAVAISALGFYFGTGLHPHWWALWLAPVPVLLISFHSTARIAFIASFTSFFLGGLTWWGYYSILELPITVRALAFIAPPIVFALATLLTRTLLRRNLRFAAVLALPVFWTSFDYLLSLGRNGTAMNLSYSQMNFLPVLQIASITGIWGIEFTFLFFAAAIAVSIATAEQERTISFAATSLAVVALVLGFGVWRLSTHVIGEQVKIGLAASDQRPLLAKDEAESAQLVQSYSAAIDKLAAEGAQIVLVPEKIGPIFNQHSGPSLDVFSEAARRNHVMVVAGFDQPDKPLKHNLAFLYGPDGNQQFVYEKHFMVPGWEDGYERGTTVARFPAPHGNWGVVICKDMDFPRLSREYAQQGVQLLFAPAWDFTVDDWLHGRMAVLRGVESGFAIARSAKQGLMTLTDSRGRVIAEQHSSTSGSATLIAFLRVSPQKTLYSQWGDWFAWICMALAVGLVGATFRPARA